MDKTINLARLRSAVKDKRLAGFKTIRPAKGGESKKGQSKSGQSKSGNTKPGLGKPSQ
jgi:hypothetical protein